MSIWILLWVLVSTFLLGFWLWSTYTLFKQKQAWRVYAEKRKMRYDSGKFYDPPTIAGTVDGYKIEIFTGDHTRFDARAERHLTGVEISLHTYLPISTVVATGGMVSVVQATQLPQEYKPEYPGWDDSYVVYTAESAVAAAYLTSKRLDHVLELLKIKNAWLVLIFMNGRGLLRLDFPDPILDPKNLDQLIKKMVAAAQTFELEKGEDISVMRKSRQIRDGQSVIKVDDEILSEKPRFELEDD